MGAWSRPRAVLVAAIVVAGLGIVAAVADGGDPSDPSDPSDRIAATNRNGDVHGSTTTTATSAATAATSTTSATSTTGSTPAPTPSVLGPPAQPPPDPAAALAEVTDATNRILGGSTSRWIERRYWNGQLASTAHGTFEVSSGLLELRFVLAAGHEAMTGEPVAPATVDDPHVTVIIDHRPADPLGNPLSVFYVDDTPGAPARWYRTSDGNVTDHPEIRGATNLIPGTATVAGSQLPFWPVFGARSATFVTEDDAGRHFEVEFEGFDLLTLATLEQFVALVESSSNGPSRNAERLDQSVTGPAVVRFGFLQSYRVDLSFLLGLLPGTVDAAPGTLVAEFELVDVNDPVAIQVPTQVVDLD